MLSLDQPADLSDAISIETVRLSPSLAATLLEWAAGVCAGAHGAVSHRCRSDSSEAEHDGTDPDRRPFRPTNPDDHSSACWRR